MNVSFIITRKFGRLYGHAKERFCTDKKCCHWTEILGFRWQKVFLRRNMVILAEVY